MNDCTATSTNRHEVQCGALQARLKELLLPESFETLARGAYFEDIETDAVLWRDGMQIPSVGILCGGYLRFQRNGLDGRRQILSLLVPGDLVGQRVHGRPECTLEAASPASIYWFDRKIYDALLRSDRSLRRAHYRNSMAQVDRLRWLTWMIGALRPDERLATLLLIAVRFMPWKPMADGTGVLTIAISRRDIADLLATTPETICRVLKIFERDGLIRMIDPVHMRMLDRSAMVQRSKLPSDPVVERPRPASHPAEPDTEAPVSQTATRCCDNPETAFV